jgi:enoyl-CoA hydratase/carnithine racemase
MTHDLQIEHKQLSTLTVTRLTLDRPDKRNALTADLVEALLAAVDTAAGDGTRLLILQGAGRCFCAGFDFSAIDEQSDADLVLRFIRIEQLLQALYYAPFATLALAHGACFGAGADLVAACSHRVLAPDTKLRMPGLRFDVVLGTRRLAGLIGSDAARSLLETSRVFDAEQALQLGFARQIRGEDAWPALIEETAQAVAALSPAAQRALLQRTRDDTGDADLAALVRSISTPGLRARIRAFLEQSKSA